VRQKHDLIWWGLLRLRPPWHPPELEIIDCQIQEAARSWSHRLEIVDIILLHPLGNRLCCPGSIVVNGTSSSCVKCCLDYVLWKLPRWWIANQCVRPANAIRDVSSWPWITSKNAKVQFQSIYSLISINCHFAKLFLGLLAAVKGVIGGSFSAFLIGLNEEVQ
jgi:hypothetical protein